MSKYLKLSVAVLLVVGALFGEPIVEFLKDNVEIINTPSVNVDEPSLEYRTLVQDIVAIDISNSDARHISDFFSQLSDVVWLDPGFIKTTGVFREFNIKAGGLNFAGLELKNKYPSLGEEIDEVIINSIGKEDVELTTEKRKNLRDCLNAVAWGVHQ